MARYRTTYFYTNQCHTHDNTIRTLSLSTTATAQHMFLQAERHFAEAEKRFESAEKRIQEAERRFKEAENDLSVIKTQEMKVGGGGNESEFVRLDDDHSIVFITENLEKRKIAFDRIERRIKSMELKLKAIELKFGPVERRLDEPLWD